MKKMLRNVAWTMALCMMLTLISVCALAVESDAYNRVVDPSTTNAWTGNFSLNTKDTRWAGGVWTDKSVFKGLTENMVEHITFDDQGDNFLVALSAIGSTESVTGVGNAPTDTMFILDMSSSMFRRNGVRNPATVQALVAATNSAIQKLMDLHEDNRVGVTVYWGGGSLVNSTSKNCSKVLMPLDRYTAGSGTSYLEATTSSNQLTGIRTVNGLKDGDDKAYSNSYSLQNKDYDYVAGTYMQQGIHEAMKQFTSADTITEDGMTRVPIFIFMADGEPTAATTDFWDSLGKTSVTGNNYVDGRNPTATDFVTQLAASYAKAVVDKHYVDTKPLFYTLTLGTDISTEVMDTSLETTNLNTIRGYWNTLVNNGTITLDKLQYYTRNDHGTIKRDGSITVKKKAAGTGVNDLDYAFPASADQMRYVDRAFQANNADALNSMFDAIIGDITLRVPYSPTQVTGGNDNISGNVSFIDKIGEYMEVGDVKGIVIDGKLYSGGELSKNFVPSGGDLMDANGNYTKLGDEFLFSIQEQLGISGVQATRELIRQAYEAGQLSYNQASGKYSNYIGWLAGADNQYLGFWEEGATLPTTTSAVYYVKSYFYLGPTANLDGVASDSNMMYSRVWVRERIDDGEQSVVFSMPAALLPLVEYKVELDEDGKPTEFDVSGADRPLKLVYEVRLKPEINKYTLFNQVDGDYLTANSSENGSYYFYTNQWESKIDEGMVNTYSYFYPNRANPIYYYTRNTELYTKSGDEYTEYKGTAKPQWNPDNLYYRKITTYKEENGKIKEVVDYRWVSQNALSTVTQVGGQWVIPAGVLHTRVDDIALKKTANNTETLPYADYPLLDWIGTSVNTPGHVFTIGAALGNNGRLELKPAYGFGVRKIVTTVNPDADAATKFTFLIKGMNGDDAGRKATLAIVRADGTIEESTITFDEDGGTRVTIARDEAAYLTGLASGLTFRIWEDPAEGYALTKINGEPVAADEQLHFAEVTVADKTMTTFEFTNDIRRKYTTHTVEGSKTLHNTELQASAFTFFLAPSDANGVRDETQAAIKAINDINGRFSFTDLVYTAAGTYYYVLYEEQGSEPGIRYDDTRYLVTVTVSDDIEVKDTTFTRLSDKTEVEKAHFDNYYNHESKTVNLSGVKELLNASGEKQTFNAGQFSFQLYQVNEKGENRVAIGDPVSCAADGSFAFPPLTYHLGWPEGAAEPLDDTGMHYYEVVEIDNNAEPGVKYDRTVYAVQVDVKRNDRGWLSAEAAIYDKTNPTEPTAIRFTNYTVEPDELVIDGQKILEGRHMTENDKFSFQLYETGADFAVSGNAELKETVQCGPDGKFAFTPIPFNAAGTHYYVVREQMPAESEKLPNVTYDASEYRVTAVVTANETTGALTHTMTAVHVVDGEEVSSEKIVFTNKYTADDVETAFSGVKTLEGRALRADDFTFELYKTGADFAVTGAAATLVDSVTNDANGKFAFGKLIYSEEQADTYYYVIREKAGEDKNIAYDATEYRATVTVTKHEDTGLLELTSVMVNAGSGAEVAANAANFANRYTPTAVTAVFGGEKTLEGRTLKAGEFTFELFEADEHFTVADGATALQSVKNDADGKFAFNERKYGENDVRTHYYVIREKKENDPNITYDESAYNVTVEVTRDADSGVLKATTTMVKNGETVAAVKFENTYTPAPVTAVFDGVKTLTGRKLNAGEFTFELFAADEDFTAGATALQSVTNKEDGTFAFAALTYGETQVGPHYYVIREKKGEDKNITYDESVYNVTVTVTRDADSGVLSQTTTMVKAGETTPVTTAAFANRYTADDVEAAFSGVKTLSGRKLNAGEFTFELYKTGADFAVTDAATLVESVKNDAEGKFAFKALTYGEEQADTHYYVIREAEGSLENITYDKSVYNVTVEVKKDDISGLLSQTTTMVKAGTGQEVNLAEFENTYTATAVETAFGGVKTLSGRKLNAGEFTFELYKTGSDFAVTGAAAAPVESVKNDADGKFAFPTLTYGEAQADTHYYVIREKKGEDKNIAYDATEYRATVKVEKNATTGKLSLDETIVQVKDGVTTGVTAIAFANVYTPDPVEVALGGEKTLEGRKMTAEDHFTFERFETDSTFGITVGMNAKETVECDTEGRFTFAPWTIDRAGTFYYLVREKTPADEDKRPNVTYDRTKYHVTVVVTADPDTGVLSHAMDIVRVAEDGTQTDVEQVTFKNKYTPDDASVILEGSKTLDGRALKEGEFTFELYKTGSDFAVTDAATLVESVKNDADGNFAFEALTYGETQADTHYYVIREAAGSLHNVTYDPTEYHVVITVTKDPTSGDLSLSKAVTQVKNGASKSVAEITFANAYDHDPAELSLAGVKRMINRPLEKDEFTFLLYETNASFAVVGAPMQTVKNQANGAIVFAPWKVADPGTYHYLVCEDDSDPIQNVVYDKTKYHVTYTVTKDPVSGELVVDAPTIVGVGSISSGEGVIFTNKLIEVDVPKTGDETDLGLWLGMVLMSLMGVTALGAMRRRKANR